MDGQFTNQVLDCQACNLVIKKALPHLFLFFSHHKCFSNGSFVNLYVLLLFHIFSVFLVKQILCIYYFLWKQGVTLCQKNYFAVAQYSKISTAFLKKGP